MSQSDFLEAELRDATEEFNRATARKKRDDYSFSDSLERAYWTGYVDAITNAINNEKGMTTE